MGSVVAIMFGLRSYRRSFGLGVYFAEKRHKLFTMDFDSPAAIRLLLVMGVLSLIFLATPGIFIFLLFSGIGIPLIPATILFPPIVLVWCCVLVFRRILPFEGRRGTFAACIATGFLLFLPAQWMNASAYISNAEVVADDHNSTVLPIQSDTLAIVNRRWNPDANCDRLCLHALLNGAASTVLVHTAPVGTSVPDGEAIATAYYFARQDTCPDVDLDPRHYALQPQGMPTAGGYVRPPQRNAAEIGAQRIASGNCLLSRKARISEADLMVVLGPIERQNNDNKGFEFKLSGAEIARLSVYKATDTNTFKEVFRETSGKSMRFFPFLLPMASWVQHEPSGWLKTEISLNNRDFSTQRSWDAFEVLEDTIGIKLTLDGSNYRSDAQDGILAVLDAGRGPSPAEWQAYTMYWKDLNFLGTGTSNRGPDAKDAGIALRIAQSPHMPLPRGFGDFVRYALMADLLPADKMGKALAARLKTGGTKSDMLQASLGMGKLPEEVLRDHQDLLVELARTPEKWTSVKSLLHNLYLSGPDAAPILHELVLAGFKQDDLSTAVQGLIGLCKIGPQARPFVQDLDERQMSKGHSDAERYFRKRIAVSAALGIEPDKIRSVLPRWAMLAQKPGWFEKQYKTGASSQWHCFRY